MGKNISELILNRRSIRKYKAGGAPTREQLKQLLEAAMLAPSARNTRPWEFIAITKKEILDEIPKIHNHAGMCVSAGAAILVVALPPKDMDTFPYEFYAQDCGAATQNILLEAVNLGLGTCWCGVYPLEERVKGFRKLLNLEEDKIPFGIIAVGTPDENPDRRGFYDESRAKYID